MQFQATAQNKKTFHSISLYRIVGIMAILFSHFIFLTIPGPSAFGDLLCEPRCGFMLLSGLLYSQKQITSIKKFYFKNGFKLLIPIVEVFVFLLIWNLMYMGITNNWDFINVWKGIAWSQGQGVVQFGSWYFALWIAVCYVLTPLMERWNSNKASIRSISKAIIIATIAINCAVVFFWKPDIKLLYPCYVVGYFIGKFKFKQYFDPAKKNGWDILMWSIITLIAIGLFAFAYNSGGQNSIKGWDYSNIFKSAMCITFGAMFGIASFFVFVLIFNLCMTNIKKSKFFGFTDKLMYYIYLLNLCFACGGTDTRNWIPDGYPWTDFVRFVVFTTLVVATAVLLLVIDIWIKNTINKKRNNKIAFSKKV